MADTNASAQLTRLHAALARHVPSVTIDSEVLGDERLARSFHTALGHPSLELTGALLSEPADDGSFTVTGTVTVEGVGASTAVLNAFVGSRDLEPSVELVLRVHARATTWPLSHGATELPGYLDASSGVRNPSFLAAAVLDDVAIAISTLDFTDAAPNDPSLMAVGTLDGRPVGEGLSFSGRFDPHGPAWRTVAAIAPLPAQTPVSGLFGVDDHGPFLELHLPLKGARWPLSSQLALTLDEITVDCGLGADGSPPVFSVLGHLDLGADYPFVLSCNVGDPSVTLRGVEHGPTLTVAALLKGLGLDATAVPALPAGLGSVGLARFELEVGLSPLAVRRLSTTILSELPIDLLDDIITVQPSVDIALHDPFGPDRVAEVTVAGLWVVGKSMLEVAYSPTAGTLSAGLRPGQALDLDAFITALLPGAPSLHVGLPDVTLWADTGSGALDVRFSVADAFRFPLGSTELEVTDASLHVSRSSRGDTPAWELHGNLDVAGIHLKVQAARSAGADWSLDASGSVDTPIDLAGLLRDALERFGGPGQPWPDGLPQAHATIGVRSIVVHHDSADGVLQLYAALDLDVELVHGIAFTHLTTSLEFDAAGLVEAWVAAGLRLGGVDVELESRFDAEHGLQFSGESADGSSIPIGAILHDLADLVGVEDGVPAALDGFVVDKLAVAYNTTSKDLSLRLNGTLPGAHPLRMTTLVALTHAVRDGASIYNRRLHGEIESGGLRFMVDFATDPTQTVLVGTYVGEAGANVSLRSLAAALDPPLASVLPATLALNVREVVLVHQRSASAAQTLFALAIDASFDLSGLPLIGRSIGSSLAVALEPTVASAAFAAADLDRVRPLLAAGPIELPGAVAAGVHVQSQLTAGEQTWRLDLPLALSPAGEVSAGPSTPKPTSTPAAGTATKVSSSSGSSAPVPAGSVTWYTIGKAFGPVHIDRVGLGFDDGELSAALDGRLTLGPLTLELLGLTASLPLDDLQPRFSLHGLSLDYRNGDVEIGGAFLHRKVARQGHLEDEYAGQVVIRTPSFSLSAMGAYSEHDGHPSLFVYAVLSRPIGGPTCFFVTGLAVGFGYNRELVMPAVTEVVDFPLVKEATGSIAAAASLGDEIDRLGQAIPPSTGSMFIAAGVKFNSFKVIDSFVLLAVQFGHQLEIDLLGVSHAVIPPPQVESPLPPLAQVELAIRARFVPDLGSLIVLGQLTPASYLFSENCRLRGGFAFAAWFGPDHAGDFVATLGGYHPHYVPEPHYPTPPRLGFTWQVDPHLLLSGEVYFALTPGALMAGGHLEATWNQGGLQAWFRAGIDLLIAWQPYHYEASLTIGIGGSYTFELFGTQHLTVHVSAELELWGPPFAGRAVLDLGVTSLTVRFGSQTKPRPLPLDWDGFSSSFLPAADKVCTVTVVEGLLRAVEVDSVHYDVVEPAALRIAVQSRFPLNGDDGRRRAGVAPMDVAPGALASALTLRLLDESGDDLLAGSDALFGREPLAGAVPAALWGEALLPDIDDAALVPNVVTGYELAPIAPLPPARSASLDPEQLAYETTLEPIQAEGDRTWPSWTETARWDLARLGRQFEDQRSEARRRRLVGALRLAADTTPAPMARLDAQLLESPRVWSGQRSPLDDTVVS